MICPELLNSLTILHRRMGKPLTWRKFCRRIGQMATFKFWLQVPMKKSRRRHQAQPPELISLNAPADAGRMLTRSSIPGEQGNG